MRETGTVGVYINIPIDKVYIAQSLMTCLTITSKFTSRNAGTL